MNPPTMPDRSTKQPPKVFVSYSWSTPSHEQWVQELANELIAAGIDVLIDKYDLKPGHDAYAFMETMVSDASVTKVLLICDKKYSEKSNNRSGGAGTEAQIISPQIYAKKDQEKYLAIIREVDSSGTPYLPAYYLGRIYINLIDGSSYHSEFEKLLRWIWDEPLNVKPPLGKKPTFISKASPTLLGITPTYRDASEALARSSTSLPNDLYQFFDSVITALKANRLSGTQTQEDFDIKVIESISELLPLRDKLVEILITLARSRPPAQALDVAHEFLERVLQLCSRPPDMNSWTDWDFDNFKFIAHEIFLYTIAAFLKSGNFEGAQYFIETEYYAPVGGGPSEMQSYESFRQPAQSLINRSRVTGRISVISDLLKERNVGSSIEFNHLQAADLVLYLRAIQTSDYIGWYPDTLLFARYGDIGIEIFKRAKSNEYLKKLLPIIGVANKEQLGGLLSKIEANPQLCPRFDYSHLPVRRITNFNNIGITK